MGCRAPAGNAGMAASICSWSRAVPIRLAWEMMSPSLPAVRRVWVSRFRPWVAMPMWDMSTGVRGNLAPAADSEHLPGLRREPAVVVQLITHRRDISRACGGTRRTAYPSAGGWDISRACGGTTGWAAAWAASRHSFCVAGRRRGRACACDSSTRSCRTASGATRDLVYQPEGARRRSRDCSGGYERS